MADRRCYDDMLREDRRLATLRLLAEATGYRLNLSVIRKSLELLAHAVSADNVRTDLAWLAEQGLLSVEDIGPTLVATLSDRGADAARGVCIVPGVARPSPLRV